MKDLLRHRLRRATAALTLGVALWGAGGRTGETVPAVVAPQPTRTVLPQVQVAPAARDVGEPTRLRIPAIGVDERLHAVGLLPSGAMETPDFGDAGWYEPGPRPGAPGPAVLVAHVHGPAGDDVFAGLHELRRGDRVSVSRHGGGDTFVVTDVEQVDKDALPYDRIWGPTRRPVLRLITCGGSPDPITRTYPDNTIVYAEKSL
ncbi:class F sortase [Aeromicrobium stalagmiti]|uniref:class F sortase n=1 Tax=Aeromicrobium stalagmiti TaxID=2738988 RepID=UPI0015693673|nr:class F sortase [Aeromicrobium stalagmiti]NRQ50528.1 class F sortase [Aeromicrobium stalagmiti]